MANVKRHKKDTSTFQELSLSGQAKSITGQIHTLEMAIKANRRESIAALNSDPLEKRIEQVKRMVGRLEKI